MGAQPRPTDPTPTVRPQATLEDVEARYEWLRAGQALTERSIQRLVAERDQARKRSAAAAAKADRLDVELADLRDLHRRRDAESSHVWLEVTRLRHGADQ